MVIYRPRRDGLIDSVIAAREFESLDAMKRYLYNDAPVHNGVKAFEMEDIVVSDSPRDDPWTEWQDTRTVGLKRFFNADYVKMWGNPLIIGHCATRHPGFAGTVKHVCLKYIDAQRTTEERERRI